MLFGLAVDEEVVVVVAGVLTVPFVLNAVGHPSTQQKPIQQGIRPAVRISRVVVPVFGLSSAS
jgi:hypothetical protein